MSLVTQVPSQTPCSSDHLMKKTFLLPSLLVHVKQGSRKLQHRRKAGEPADHVDSHDAALGWSACLTIAQLPIAFNKLLTGNSSDNNSFVKRCPVTCRLHAT